eukprot:TRINITY_DN8038_c0_g1_i1.p1 TRINITY_DN8038_c0_g1~~TRINITY_DN8038_c0_g1_i1.p1  ORF type:complete len:876 (+),score=168.19 TRINITY_DN8038_c0_g1_i1:30-2630(+)
MLALCALLRLLLVVCGPLSLWLPLSGVCAAESPAVSPTKAGQKAEKALRTAVAGAATGNKKVAAQRVKRALQAFKSAGAVDDALLREAETVLQGLSEGEARLQVARAELIAAIGDGQGGDRTASALEDVLARATAAGLTQGPEVAAARKELEKRNADKKKASKREAKRQKVWRELAALIAASPARADVASLRAAIDSARSFLSVNSGSAGASTAANATETALFRDAEKRLAEAEWAALPRSERLERATTAHGRDKCGPRRDSMSSGLCRPLPREALLRRSRAIGERDCQHKTLQDDGAKAPHPNPLPTETARSFCKYPPPFDLVQSEDGRGVRPVAFEFPKKLFNMSMLQEDDFGDLAVVNLDMDLFRSHVVSCGAKQLWLIEFYVHWCPHCMTVMPKLYKLAVALKSSGAQLQVGAVNCATERDLCGAFGVMGHPMVSFFYGSPGANGQVQLFEYNGRDIRVNAALDSVKQNRDPAWDAGAPKGLTLPTHLFPAEAADNIVSLLPEEYKPGEKVLWWLANSTRKIPTTSCAEARKWYQPIGNASAVEGDLDDVVGVRATVDNSTKKAVAFPGNGWPRFEHAVTSAHRLQDAAQSLVYILEEWVVPNPAGAAPHAFAFTELTELRAWVALVAENFPTKAESELELHPLVVTLRERLDAKLAEIDASDGEASLCTDEWQRLVAPIRRALDAARASRWLPTSCRSETCRLWALLHVLTVAPLARMGQRQQQQQQQPVLAGLVGEAAFDAITPFLRRYFTCRSCRAHFVEAVEAGSHGLVDAKTAAGRGDAARALALWWWRLHSAVSVRLARDGKCKADRRWPPADICIDCWNSSSDAAADPDEEVLAQELIRQYWPSPSGRTEVAAAA